MYQALYRKYRPTTLDEIAGQRVITKTLINEIMHNKLSHAYLFAGPRGTGKTSIAKIIAKIVNCEHPNGIKPCNECVNCTQYNLKQSNDIIEIDAASNNGVDEIRELKSKVSLVPSTGKYKIYIIDEVHMLTVGAFNALLKTLEEPPAHIIFILATTDPHKIPNTILSRCQRFDFEKISEKDIVERLNTIVRTENISITEEALYEIARLSDGGMRDSISMLDQVISYVDEEEKIDVQEVHAINGTLSQVQLTEFIQFIIQKDLENTFLKLDEYNHAGKNFIKLTEEIIMYLRNLLLMNEVPNYFKNNNYNVEIYQNIAQEINTSDLIEMIDVLNKALPEMKIASSPKIILEMKLIKLLSKNNNVQNTQNNITTTVPVSNERKIKKEQLVQHEDQRKQEQLEKEEQKLKQENSIPPEETIQQSMDSSIVKNDELKQKIKRIKDRRIENTLATFNKKLLLEFRASENEIRSKILDPEYNQLASMVLDGELKAAGNDSLIYVYPDVTSSDLFNENLISLEKMFEVIFNKKLKLISTDQIEWDQIKNEFNKKLKTYHYQEEDFQIEEILSTLSEETGDKMASLFGNIVEYE